ncbi:MAG TPA: hypothetical protein VFQ68_31720 [Streptosporangiaceae bacterium]|nr:hypothetical protein [Streptosporangiaceae bacterium]
MTSAELLRSLHAEADRIAALGSGLRDRIDTLTDPTAAEAEVEAIRAAAEQRAAAAEARAAVVEQRAAQAEQFRAEADAAAGCWELGTTARRSAACRWSSWSSWSAISGETTTVGPSRSSRASS